MTHLRKMMLEELQRRNYSQNTTRSYLQIVRDFALHFKRPPDLDNYSFALPNAHYREFSDMLAAGIDFVLPVYWGEPGHPGRTNAETCPRYWSTDGIPPMVAALDRLEAEGTPLRVGMFYDTTILANADLATPAG